MFDHLFLIFSISCYKKHQTDSDETQLLQTEFTIKEVTDEEPDK